MYSILAGRCHTSSNHLSCTGCIANLSSLPAEKFLPTASDFQAVRANLIILASRILTQYLGDLSLLSKAIPKHIMHKYSNEMAVKSEVVVVDVLMKNEASHSDMTDILSEMHGYLGQNYPGDRRVP